MSADAPETGAPGAEDDEATLVRSLLASLQLAEGADPDAPWPERLRAAEADAPTGIDCDLAAAQWLQALEAAEESTGTSSSTHPAHTEPEPSCPVKRAIQRSTDLGEVAHVGPALDRPFGTTRRVRTRTGGGTRRLDVRACRQPEEAEDCFGDSLASQLERWAAVSDLDGVVPVLDGGTDPEPWIATAGTGPSLRERETDSLARALRQAGQLAATLARLHERGVVHAGIDPDNVVYPLSAGGRPTPAFHNVGLVDVYRRHDDPATVLDARYAAPEFFDKDAFGIVDRSTDVYQLGTVSFRLLTGRTPFEGDAETIRAQVTEEPLPTPSMVEERLPRAVDEVLCRATAKDKFDRFESGRAFHDALVDACDGLLD